jgi:hypothetical protein
MKQVLAYKCTHCGKVYENKGSCKAHEYKCYFNPRTRSCASCAFNTIGTARIIKNNSFIQFPSCLTNVDISKEGLQTRCSKYLGNKYKEDEDIMYEVQASYDPYIAMKSFIKKHPQIFE